MRHVFPQPPLSMGIAWLTLLAALVVAPAVVASGQDREPPKPPKTESPDGEPGAPQAPVSTAPASTEPVDTDSASTSATVAVGEKLPADLILRGRAGDADGVPRARVYVFWSPTCPVCLRYAAVLRKLMDDFETRATVALVVSSDTAEEVVNQALAAQELRLPLLRDTEGRVARRLGVRVSPTAVVIDAGGALRYRGPLDDDRRARERDARDHLRPALDAVLTGKTVETSEVRAFGSALRR